MIWEEAAPFLAQGQGNEKGRKLRSPLTPRSRARCHVARIVGRSTAKGRCSVRTAAIAWRRRRRPSRAAATPAGTTCSACGTANPPGMNFCKMCGTSLMAKPRRRRSARRDGGGDRGPVAPARRRRRRRRRPRRSAPRAARGRRSASRSASIAGSGLRARRRARRRRRCATRRRSRSPRRARDRRVPSPRRAAVAQPMGVNTMGVANTMARCRVVDAGGDADAAGGDAAQRAAAGEPRVARRRDGGRHRRAATARCAQRRLRQTMAPTPANLDRDLAARAPRPQRAGADRRRRRSPTCRAAPESIRCTARWSPSIATAPTAGPSQIAAETFDIGRTEGALTLRRRSLSRAAPRAPRGRRAAR